MIVLDASVWISALHPQDINHVISDRWLVERTGRRNKIVVPAIFLAEVGGAIARRVSDASFGHAAVKDILRDPSFELIAVDHTLAALAAQYASDFFLRGADSIYVALASQLNMPLVTWDNELLTRATDLIRVQSPTP